MATVSRPIRALVIVYASLGLSCSGGGSGGGSAPADPNAGSAQPVAVTSRVRADADDCALWVHPTTPSRSLILGTDKGSNGGLHVWDLTGAELQRLALTRPNNVDVRQEISIDGAEIDLAVVNLRTGRELRAYAIDAASLALSDVTSAAGMPTPETEDPYGLCLYRRDLDGALFAFVTSLSGARGIIFQYRLDGDGEGRVRVTLVRQLGGGSIQGEIEGLVADDALGYVYAAEENEAVHKFSADPGASGDLLASFAIDDGIRGDREGLALYLCDDDSGYILFSSQGNSTLKVYPREGSGGDPHSHPLLLTVRTPGTDHSDGIDATSAALSAEFPEGLVVKHDSGDRRFAIFRWEDIAGGVLADCP